MQTKVSAVIITYNEEKNISRCLESIKGVVDEIVVVDSFSTDATKQICQEYEVRFFENKFEGHIQQKNFAKDKTVNDFILSLDADEALDDQLKKSIIEVKKNRQYLAYKMNRLTNYCGKWIYHSGWYPDTKVRLFLKSAGEWGGINPHDRFIPKDEKSVAHLEGDLLHYSFYTREEHLQQIHKFSTIGAKALFEKGRRSNGLKIVAKAIARFLKSFFIKKGFLDGKEGFTIARLSAYSNYLKYSKLLQLQKQKPCKMKKPTVLHIVTALSWRGGEQQAAYLISELKDEVNTIVLCSEGSKMQEFCKAVDISYHTVKKRSGIDLNYARKIKKLCKNYQVDCCHLHDAHAHTFSILAATIFANKTDLILSRRVDFPVKDNWFSRFKYNHHSIKKILCVSEKIKEIMKADILNKTLLHTVYSGIDLDKFEQRSGKFRKELGISDQQFLVGNTSALADHKDYFTFLDTAEKVIAQDEKVHFIILGNGPMKNEVKAYAETKQLNNQLSFLGFRTDVPQILADFDCFLITSKTEGLGTSILDAFACKVPVVATKAGGIPELVENEKTGLLCEVKNSDQLVEAVNLLKNDKEVGKKLAQGAFEKVQDFSKVETAKQTLQHYLSLQN